MKKVTLFFAILLIAITLKAQVKPTDTDGDGYYNISTLDHLRWVSENDYCWDNRFELDSDIDAGDTKNWNVGDHDYDATTVDSAMGWSPIGNYSKKFTGIFDGHGYAIDGLYINRPCQDYIALFGYTSSNTCQIKDFCILNCSITGDDNVGGFAGYNNSTIITNSYVTGSITGFINVGGFAGYNNSTIMNSYSTADVTGYINVGGLIGKNDSLSSLTNSYSTVNVTGYQNIGGLVGYNDNVHITSCYATADVTGSSCVDGNYIGGLVGKNNNAPITNCYATGTITGKGPYVGGLVGKNNNAPITNSYATGSVIGEGQNVGGLIGYNSHSSITNCFWDTQTSGRTNSAGTSVGKVEGKTTAEMKTKSTFTDAGWDFKTIWAIDGITNDGYPFFGTTTGAVTENILPTSNLTCYPNPCNTSTTIAYSANNAGFVNITVYDMQGNEVATLVNNYQSAGEHEVIFNAEELSIGIYFITINTAETMETKKIIVE